MSSVQSSLYSLYYQPLKAPVNPDGFPPADVVGLAGGLQFQTVGLLFFFVRADGDDGLTPAFRTCCLVAERA